MIKKVLITTIIFGTALLFIMSIQITGNEPVQRYGSTDTVKLPEPKYNSKVSIEKALLERRSVREYKNNSLALAEISQLLWASQGITDPRGFRTAPSAGALYPLRFMLLLEMWITFLMEFTSISLVVMNLYWSQKGISEMNYAPLHSDRPLLNTVPQL